MAGCFLHVVNEMQPQSRREGEGGEALLRPKVLVLFIQRMVLIGMSAGVVGFLFLLSCMYRRG